MAKFLIRYLIEKIETQSIEVDAEDMGEALDISRKNAKELTVNHIDNKNNNNSDCRVCDFCNGHTNSKQRVCCSKGYSEDLNKIKTTWTVIEVKSLEGN